MPLGPVVKPLITFAILVAALGAVFFLSAQPAIFSYPELVELESDTERTFSELSAYFTALAEEKGASYAFDVLRRAKLPHGTDFHLLGHEIGYVLYDEQGIEGIKACTDDFRNACSHSVVISAFIEHGEAALPEIIRACKAAPGGKGAYTMCFHGLGHGVLAYTGYDLRKAVTMCEKTGTDAYDDREHVECVGGAVMEMTAGVHDPSAWRTQAPKYFKNDDPLYPCTADFISDVTRPICLVYLSPQLFAAAGLDLTGLEASYAPAFRFCDSPSLKRQEDREACYGGFGKEFVAFAAGRDIRDIGSLDTASLQKVRDWCEHAGTSEGKAACNQHALASLFWGGENDVEAAFFFCGLAKDEGETACLKDLSDLIGYYLAGTARGTQYCARLPDEYRKHCRP